MTSMHLLRTFPLLALSPMLPLQCSACRSSPVLSQRDALRPQSFPASALSNFAAASPKRGFSTTPPVLRSATFAYRIGASFSAKGRRFRPKDDVYTFNATTSSTIEDIYTGRPAAGQDAFFVSALRSSSSSNNNNNVAFGVTDGVGGWADSGIDSADFSHGLCHAMAQVAIEEGDGGGKRRADKVGKRMGPKELLDRAYMNVVEAEEIEGGGSTACVAIGREDGIVTVANLGDSGFIQLRPSAVHYSSNPQTHAFNTPYQLSIVPPRMLQMSKIFGGEPLADMPSAADVSIHSVRHGDVFVFGTDGVWDNLSSDELLKVVSKQMMSKGAWTHDEGKSDVGAGLEVMTKYGGAAADGKGSSSSSSSSLQTRVAAAVVSEAKAASINERRDGPFAREVQRHYPGEGWRGGKVDDICVVVAVVVQVDNGEHGVGKPKL